MSVDAVITFDGQPLACRFEGEMLVAGGIEQCRRAKNGGVGEPMGSIHYLCAYVRVYSILSYQSRP